MKRTPEEVLDTLIELCADVELTEKEVDEELREMGYDPEEMGKRFKELAERLLSDSKRTEGRKGSHALL